MNKSNKEQIRKNAFAAMDAAAESEIQETGADLIVATEDLREAVPVLRGNHDNGIAAGGSAAAGTGI